MPMAVIQTYLERLPERMAEWKLMMADVIILPHIKDSERKTTLNRWMRTIQIHGKEPVRPASKAHLMMMGIGVRYVE